LQALRARSLHRTLREIGSAQGSIVDLVGKRLINFSSNDYLGLAGDPRLRAAATAAIADANHAPASARVYRATADDMQRRIKSWTVTTNGPLAADPYFIRLSKTGDPNAAISYNLGNGGPTLDQRGVVDAGFLELTRLGVLPPADADIVARRIHDITAQPFEVSGTEVCATVSIGIALSASAHARVEDLLLDADAAMYRAKAQGRARSVVFDPSLRERAPHLFELEGELRHALVREEFRVHYLPIVDVVSGRIQGLEALIRWAHPTRGLIAPEHFVPFAEETGLMVPIGRWLLGQAGREFQSWRGAAPERLTLSVNLSSRQLEHSDLLENIEGVLAEHSLEAQDLILELTENTLQNGEHAVRMAQLRDRGLRLSMDDFGTGSCSLNSLLRSQFDCLKIDRSLFTGGSPRGQQPELVRTILSLARDLGTQVVAEGVETAEQFGFLREVGCAAAQGFYFSPPVDSAGARSLLERTGSW